jgi:CheY-like chemotaxis protein
MATILVVDDEKPVRNFLIALLTPQHQVVEAGNVAGAIEAAHRTRPWPGYPL